MEEAARTERFVPIWICAWALTGALAAIAIAVGPLESIPHVQDEVVYQLQADTLLEGRLWLDELRPHAAYQFEFVVNADGRRYGIFPMGWPVALALGSAVGAPWLPNALLHALTVILLATAARRLAGRNAALLTAPIVALSPALVLMAGTRMSHTLCAALASAALFLWLQGHSRARAVGVGACLGWLLVTRPLDGVVVGLVFAVATVVRERRAVLAWWPAAIPAALAVALVLALNSAYTGDWSTFPQNDYFANHPPTVPNDGFRPGCNDLGFGDDKGCFEMYGSLGHTPAKAARFTGRNLAVGANLWFGLWPLALLLLPAFADRRMRGVSALVLAGAASVAGAYALYWYFGTSYGARFYHSFAPGLVLVVALSLAHLVDRFRLPWSAGLVVLLAFTLRFLSVLPELPGYWGVDNRIERFEARWNGPDNALILVYYGTPLGEPRSLEETHGGDFVDAPWLQRGNWYHRDTRLTYAEYHPSLVQELVRLHPGRPVFVWIMTSLEKLDRVYTLQELTELEPLPPQRRDLDLPAPVPVFHTDGVPPGEFSEEWLRILADEA